MTLNIPVNEETEKAIESFVEGLLRKEMSLVDIQAQVKEKFASELKSQLGENAFAGFALDINQIRSVHHGLCDKEKRNFECAGLTEDF